MEKGFLELYEYCQTLEPAVSRKHIRKKIKEMHGTCPLIIRTKMDLNISRGYFVSANNENSKFCQLTGKNVIVLAKELNYCWERFVSTKELMHVFDKPNEFVDSSVKLKNLLNSFEISPTITNDKESYYSEIIAFWRALCCLCPEKSRQEFLSLYNKGHIDSYGIALRLRIPEQYVPSLLDDRFLEKVEVIKN